MAPRPTEIRKVAELMDPSGSEESKALALEIINALDAMRLDRDQWIVGFRSSQNTPNTFMGPWSTKNQAMRAAAKVAFLENPETTPGVGWVVSKMYGPTWIDSM